MLNFWLPPLLSPHHWARPDQEALSEEYELGKMRGPWNRSRSCWLWGDWFPLVFGWPQPTSQMYCSFVLFDEVILSDSDEDTITMHSLISLATAAWAFAPTPPLINCWMLCCSFQLSHVCWFASICFHSSQAFVKPPHWKACLVPMDEVICWQWEFWNLLHIPDMFLLFVCRLAVLRVGQCHD